MKIETERLILRKPRMSDVEDIVEGIGDINVSKYLSSVSYPYTKEDAENWIKKTINTWKKKKKIKYVFVIELKNEKKVIGATEISIKLDIGSTGSWINRKYWNKGYITEAKIAVNDFGFNNLGIRKMESSAIKENIASNSMQKKMGYVCEGCRRKHCVPLSTNKIYDENLYGLLKSEWKNNSPKLKKHLKEKIKKLGEEK